MIASAVANIIMQDRGKRVKKMFEMLQYDFLVRALVVGLLVAICSSLLGVSLVLKRYSMIGDGLSHVGFGALAVASALNLAPLHVSIPVVMLAAFILIKISSSGKIKGDAAIALLSSSAMAIGIIILSKSNSGADMNSYMFGSIMAISNDDLVLSVICSVVVIALFVLFYNKIFGVTFDESFSKATGVKADLYNTVLALLTALTVVVGMRIMGALLISSLIIFPALTSMRVFKSFKGVTICSALISSVCYIIGMEVTYNFDLPAGASVVVVNLGAFLLFAVIGLFIRRQRKG